MSARRAARGVAIATCGAVAFLGFGDARAQEAPPEALGGYQGLGASTGLNAYYLPQGALPLETFIDLGAPDALASITSGPTTFARASAADPGDLLASPETLFTNASPDYPAGTVPSYPYRVSATSGFGAPAAESEPAPGLRAEVEAKQNGSTARATMPRAAAPAVATFGSVSASASTSTDGSTVSVHVRTTMSDFNLLGMLLIDSIVTDLTATSDGTTTKLTGDTKVSGAEILGTPVTIDDDGIHGSPRQPSTSGPGPLIGAIGSATDPLAEVLAGADGFDEVLRSAGIRVTAARPVEQDAGTEGQLDSGGLRIDFELSSRTAPALVTLTDALPPVEPIVPGAPGVEDLVAFARAHHLTRLEVARGMVSLAATPAFTYEAPPFASPGDSGTAGFAPTGDVPVAAPAAASPVSPTQPGSPLSTTPATALPDLPLGVGIGALVALVLLAQPFLGARLARFSTGLLAAGDTASCPLEERP
ncbi:MAG: choice-of-anchor P family protein [Acidimicrobiales bacterium]